MADIILKTDQTGANDPIYSGYSRIFNFSLTKTYNVASGVFSMKKGSASTDGVTATIYNAFNGGGSAITSVFIDTANFLQNFTDMTFNFSNYSLSSGNYSMVLSSLSPSGGSSNYFIKSGNFQITDSSTGTVLIVGIGLAAAIDGNSTLTSTAKQGFNQTTSGGVLINGVSGIFNIFSYTTTNGVLVSGSNTLNTNSSITILANGVLVSGSSTLNTNSSITILADGVLASGSSTPNLNSLITALANGILASGSGTLNTNSSITILANGVLVSGSSTLNTNSSITVLANGVLASGYSEYVLIGVNNSEEDEQDLYFVSWHTGNRDHWGLTKGLHKRIWSAKTRNESFGSQKLRNVQSLD